MNIFVAGTDTGIGKTFVSAALCLRKSMRYWKPVQSGTLDHTDSDWVAQFLGPKHCWPETYRLNEPLSPHASAKLDGVQIESAKILEASRLMRNTVVEGAGGLLVPLNSRELYIDLIAKMKMPLLLVARSGLGTINHTLLSLEAARARGVEPLGVVMVGEENSSNREALEHYGRTQVLAEIPFFETIDRTALLIAADRLHLKEVENVHSQHA